VPGYDKREQIDAFVSSPFGLHLPYQPVFFSCAWLAVLILRPSSPSFVKELTF
jgi:hypothetical protein